MKKRIKHCFCLALIFMIALSGICCLPARAEDSPGRPLSGEELLIIESKVLGALMKVGFDRDYSETFGKALNQILVDVKEKEIRETSQSGVFSYYIKFTFVDAYNVYQEMQRTNSDLLDMVGLSGLDLLSQGELMIYYDSAEDRIIRIENKGDVYTGLRLYCISENKLGSCTISV